MCQIDRIRCIPIIFRGSLDKIKMRPSDEENQIHLHQITIYHCYIPHPACTKQMNKYDRYQTVTVCRENQSHHPGEGLSCDTRRFL